MDKHYTNIKQLIEDNLVIVKKNQISSNNHTLITYYNIGKEIVKAQGGEARAKYGEELIKSYSLKLEKKYGRNYSYRSLWKMRQFYLVIPKLPTLSAQLNWSIIQEIIPIKEESKRNYYMNSVVEHNFSVRGLREYIKTNAYERLINKENIKLKYIDNVHESDSDILDMIKDPILITINKSLDKITEKALKKFMLEQIEKTMLELGIGFAYVGSEVPIKIDNKILRPDLVFFNYELTSFVIIELKLKELTIKDIGQIEFYVKYYDSHIKKPFYNPTIGITISKRINENIINYVKKENIKHSTYELIEK